MNAIDIDDFVYAATGARLRRLTLPDGSHWFPAVDVARALGHRGVRQALRAYVGGEWYTTLGELPVGPNPSGMGKAGRKDSMLMVCLEGVVQLVNASPRAQTAPFRAWAAEVVAGVRHRGYYDLERSPTHAGFVLPQRLLDALVRLEEGELLLDEGQVAVLREAGRDLRRIAESLERASVPGQRDSAAGRMDSVPGQRDSVPGQIDAGAGQIDAGAGQIDAGAGQIDAGAGQIDPGDVARAAVPVQRAGHALTPQELLASWRERDVVVSADVHAVAAYLAPALVRGGVRYRLEEVARRTGLTSERVRDCVRMLVERGCMRHAGGSGGNGGGGDGGLLYVLP